VLAVLLLDLGRVVSAEVLIDRVWGEDPPRSVRNVLYGYVARLRAVIAGAGDPDVTLTRYQGGYVLRAGQDQVDVYRFRLMVAEAAAAGDDERAAVLLQDALVLWRGPALAGLGGPWLDRMRDSLEMERVAAVLDLNDVRLRLGEHRALAGELPEQAASTPGDERLIGQLMLALYRSGRKAEALHRFERTRRYLAGELGADPGPGLRALHRQVLTDDPTLSLPEPDRPAAGRTDRAAPQELPATVTHFVGRTDELAVLTRLVEHAGEQPHGTIVISAIGGTAGVGKTALAVQWAHQVAELFPDGQLYVNLRGYDPAQPMSATDVLAGFLRSLGVPGQDIPPEQDERAARYRSLLAGKRLLIVLDNAGSADQVRPLLPGTSACAVVVTSRDALAGLVARNGGTRLDLDVLPQPEAVALLRTLIGARADADPAATAELAGQCCRLPLALRVAAELAASHPAISLARLTAELADQRTRLDLLDAGGDPGTEVRTVFSWSYRHLDAGAARAFRLLGLHPGPDLDPYAAAALTGTTVPQVGLVLDVLARAHLISPTSQARYGMHDLLRSYARELAATLDDDAEQDAALTRLFDFLLHTAAAAMDTLVPAERHRRPRIPRPATPVPPIDDPATARYWLDAERAALVAAAAHAAAHSWPGHATRLAAILSSYLRNGGHLPEATAIFSHALGAARRTGDRAAQASALNQIGLVDWAHGRIQQATNHHEQALALFRAAGDRAGEASAMSNIGLAETEMGRYEQAACLQQEAATILREVGDRIGEARALGNLGLARRLQGRYQEAAGYYQQTLDVFRETGDLQGEAWTLMRLGIVDLRLDRYQHAARYLEHAQALFRDMGNTGGEAECLVRLGDVYLGLSRYEQAIGSFQQALAMYRAIDDLAQEADALNGLGEVLFRTGEADTARADHTAALRLASEADSPLEQARAHSGLARVCQAGGDSAQARQHWQEALTRYMVIGAPEADEIRVRLAAVGDDGDSGGKPAEGDGATTARSNR
jgi:tetratricopeptide (TPR) repeat protein/DNA-binding SARP family transcriptional activator